MNKQVGIIFITVEFGIRVHSSNLSQGVVNKNSTGSRTESCGTPYNSSHNLEMADPIFTPQPLRAVGVLFSPMVSGWAFWQAFSSKKFVRAIFQKP